MDDLKDEFILANDIVENLLGYSVSFTYYEQIIEINKYAYVKFSKSTSIVNDSYRNSKCKINHNLSSDIYNFSNDYFSIDDRAQQLAIKLKGIIDNGEVIVNPFSHLIGIQICIYKTSSDYVDFQGSVIIAIKFPSDNERKTQLEKSSEYSKNKEEEQEFKKVKTIIKDAANLGKAAIAGVILFKLIKAGIGGLFAGPFGAAVGFCS